MALAAVISGTSDAYRRFRMRDRPARLFGSMGVF
jgi:hypothetical protein